MAKLKFRCITTCMLVSVTIVCIIFLYLDNKIFAWDRMPTYIQFRGTQSPTNSTTTSTTVPVPGKTVHRDPLTMRKLTVTPFAQRDHPFRLASQPPPKPFYKKQSCAVNVDVVPANIDTERILHDLDTRLHDRLSHERTEVPPLTVIVVPHSHNDPGWLNTVDEYFETKTKLILDNMLKKLVEYPKMTFVWGESVFLSMWFKELNSRQQETVRILIARRQLEIVGGGWVVPDEASTHYYALIDQMIEGHQWLNETLNVRPTNTWALDPFGYSASLPYLYKRAGFENMVILRVHTQVKEYLAQQKHLEFSWHQSWHSYSPSDIFTQMMPYKLYNIEHTCGPNKKVCVKFDFVHFASEKIVEQNVKLKACLLLEQYRQKATNFRHGILLVPLGDDFRYDTEIEWDKQYSNYMRLFAYINTHRELNTNIRFGTVNDYFTEVHKTVLASTFPTLSGDFFPYTDDSTHYWTGYFTTRPYLKMVGRTLEARLRAAEILQSLAAGHALSQHGYFPQFHHNTWRLMEARKNLALFQHHDAITGTSRAYVAEDYSDRLHTALNLTGLVVSHTVSYLLSKPPSVVTLNVSATNDMYMHPDSNTVIAVRNKPVDLVLFNTIAQRRTALISVIIDTDQVKVTENVGRTIVSQINPVWTRNGTIKPGEFELLFLAATLPALGISTYKLRHVSNPEENFNYAAYIGLHNVYQGNLNIFRFKLLAPKKWVLKLENEYYHAEFSPTTGALKALTTKYKSGVKTTGCAIEFLMYKSRGSGAYIFQSTGPPVATEISSSPIVRVIRGPIVSEVHVIRKKIEHRVRLVNSTAIVGAALHIHNIVDLRRAKDKELIMRLTSDVRNDSGSFYTDLNGFQMMHRRRLQDNFPRESNYYPMTSTAYVEDGRSRLSLLSGQSLGVGSEAAGSLEVMLDRHLLYDDKRGLSEGITDNRRTVSRFSLMLEHRRVSTPDNSPSPSLLSHRLTAILQQPVLQLVVAGRHDGTPLPQYAPLSALPPDVQLVNLRSLAATGHHHMPATALLLRRVASHCAFPHPKRLTGSLKLHNMFRHLKPSSITEMTLSLMYEKRSLNQSEVILHPMEIYAFKLHL